MSHLDPAGRSSRGRPPASRLAEERAGHRGQRGQRGRRRQGRKGSQGRKGGGTPRVSCLAMILFVLLFAGAGTYMFARQYISPPDYSGSGTGSVVIEVEKGATLSAIAVELERSGVVKSERAFVQATQDNPQATSIQPGHYELNRRMQAALAFERLLNPDSKLQARVTIPEGKRVSEIFKIIDKKTDISVKKLKKVAGDPEDIGLPGYAKSLEGYLFPATYNVTPDDTAKKLLTRMITEFKHVASDVQLKRAAKRHDMSAHEMVTLASLVQGEVSRDQDFPKVSAVVYNRLDEGMPLEFSSTVNYALKQRKLGVTHKETGVKSPYNTYQHRGLPPGPINSPGRKALKAALNPAQGDWIYFVTTHPAKGITKFTANYQQFLEFKAEFKRNRS